MRFMALSWLVSGITNLVSTLVVNYMRLMALPCLSRYHKSSVNPFSYTAGNLWHCPHLCFPKLLECKYCHHGLYICTNLEERTPET